MISGNAAAGLYVGDSPHARATLTGNLVHDNGQFGIFLRDSRHGTVSGNTVTGNCLGIGVLETPSPVHPGAYRIADNQTATIADWNPVSAVTAAARELFDNPNPSATIHDWPMQHPVAASLLWSVALLAVFAPLASVLYRRRTAT
mgnify:CR=1 FL=1